MSEQSNARRRSKLQQWYNSRVEIQTQRNKSDTNFFFVIFIYRCVPAIIIAVGDEIIRKMSHNTSNRNIIILSRRLNNSM